MPTPGPANFGLNRAAPDIATIAQKQAQNAPASALDNISSRISHVEQHGPFHEGPENAAVSDTLPAPPEPEEPGTVPEDLLALPPAEDATEDGEPATGEFTEFTWLSLGVSANCLQLSIQTKALSHG